MQDDEDSGNENPTSTPREDMEEMLAHYQSYIIEPGDEDLPNYKPQKIQTAEAIADRITVLTNLEFAYNTNDPERWGPMILEMKNTCWFIASPAEQEIMQDQGFSVDSYDMAILYKQILYALLWALNEYDDLNLAPVNMHKVFPRLKEIAANPEKFKQTITVRPADQILQALADTFKVYMESKLSFDAGNEEGNMGWLVLSSTGSLVALLWLIDNSEWDDILCSLFEQAFLESTVERKDEDGDDSGSTMRVLGGDGNED
ncbi:DUF4272 domain-containing protein [Cryomorpha ignava]|uniref:DUF4272 domain-containing protein n=1 Tax=Cryomorpha ignava TaxID=101383 RepID=A0A7K3WV49_9FLAO|nr:DUF4272 domain-containing protein [Cryomorpha ignava]NEN25374.1 DUF4272 domain-containing protein [Cryomorpha ignava]